MSRGKYLSLEEARNSGKIAQFATEHPSTADKEQFEGLLSSMCEAKDSPPKAKEKKSVK